MTNKPFPEYQKQNHSKVQWSQKRKVHGLDTETFMGKAVLICDEKFCIEPTCIEDVLRFLSRHSTRASNNFFFNIKFDFGAMMKWLDNGLLTELINTGELEYEPYKIRYLPRKVLTISKYHGKGHKDVSEYYDLTNFYHGSLKKNMQERLKIRKFGSINTGLLNRSWGYYGRNRDEIIKYCIRDALGAKELGELLQESYYKTIGIYPKKYISTANITSHYYKTRCYIPSMNKIMKETPGIAQYYWNAYNGGRFEVFRKGWFENPVYDYDLKSAYPKTIAELININMGEWREVDGVNKDAYYGVYKCLVSAGSGHVMPFGFKVGQRIMYPQEYENIPYYLTKGEIGVYKRYADINVIDGYEYYPDRIIKPFDKVVKDIFKTKEEIKIEFGKDSSEYDVIKKCLNTYYGVNVNINDGVAGRFFNPIYGAEITADCKKQVYAQAVHAGNSLISIETDGLWTDKKIPGIRTGKDLGSWDQDERKTLYLTGSGQLAVEGLDGSRDVRTRGIPRKKAPILELAKKFPNEKSIVITRDRPVGMKEALILNKMDLSKINVWETFTSRISCNSGRERLWDRQDYTFGELLHTQATSTPWEWEIIKDDVKFPEDTRSED